MVSGSAALRSGESASDAVGAARPTAAAFWSTSPRRAGRPEPGPARGPAARHRRHGHPRRPGLPHPAGPPDRRPPGDHRGPHRPATSGPPPHTSPAAPFLNPEHRPDSPRSVPPSNPVGGGRASPPRPITSALTSRSADPFGPGPGLDASPIGLSRGPGRPPDTRPPTPPHRTRRRAPGHQPP
jgi:hypothetical protein